MKEKEVGEMSPVMAFQVLRNLPREARNLNMSSFKAIHVHNHIGRLSTPRKYVDISLEITASGLCWAMPTQICCVKVLERFILSNDEQRQGTGVSQ